MGQFLGFSDDHSSLVVNVRNLRTGYVCLQFHIVFDDLFQTVFSSCDNDIIVDAICNHMLESNWYIYAQDELSMTGEMIYCPPPLDEVWLSEPERHDRREKMQAKHC